MAQIGMRTYVVSVYLGGGVLADTYCCSSHFNSSLQCSPWSQKVLKPQENPENKKKSKYRVGKHDALHPTCCTRDEGAQKMNQFANWTNIAAGIHSTTYSIGVSSVPTTNQLVDTDYQVLTTSTAAIVVAVWYTAFTVQKAR